MEFHEERFPIAVSFGASGGPERRTEIVTLTNGYEERNTPWANSRRRYDAGAGLRSLDDLAEVFAFFEARRGPLHGFRWKDWADYKSCAPSEAIDALDQQIALGTDADDTFALIKTYGEGAHAWQRRIEKPVPNRVLIAVSGDPQIEGVDYELDDTTGLVTFSHPPALGAVISAGFEFDVPARFDTERLEVSVETFGAGAMPRIEVVEIRL
ncbi:DUF2460 domain-containing protein [Pseudoroseicyclus aestuarii]|uniref:Uncharacterized protein (TIGR02217 family) n=1 Tax=Pseudoroseicyclus aestuarii TaxID=1795041 RepID=A0A318SW49_9RHOB|nr:DUF2460 domain-containing protein [Pseudoroseicyclus aestuarii]PYE85722.1 uncharacterized protein (TIGR02217 family) [Pseudoroseicyclus aestuarii]